MKLARTQSALKASGNDVFRIVDVVLPEATNHYGTLFAGNVVAFMVKAAYLAATHFTRKSMVLAGSERIDCITPIPEGSVIEATGRVIRQGKSSVTIQVELFSKGPVYKDHLLAARGTFSLVAVDRSGRPKTLRQ